VIHSPGGINQACDGSSHLTHSHTLWSHQSLQVEVSQQRQAAEHYLLHHTTNVPADNGPAALAFRLLRLGACVPTAGLLDLARCAWQPQLFRSFNPLLSDAACSRLQAGVLTWLQLCVLEDRLGRLVALAAAADAAAERGHAECRAMHALIKVRSWPVYLFGSWLTVQYCSHLSAYNEHVFREWLHSQTLCRVAAAVIGYRRPSRRAVDTSCISHTSVASRS
jgi:hypothetical protein